VAFSTFRCKTLGFVAKSKQLAAIEKIMVKSPRNAWHRAIPLNIKLKNGAFMTTEIWRKSRNSLVAGAAMALLTAWATPGVVRADDRGSDDDWGRVRRGLEIAPVPLSLAGKDLRLVGLGSYLVNAVASCNDCHSAGPATEYAPGGNPYFKGNPPKVVNQNVYLGGGRDFGSLIPGTPDIVSRNLTPDKTGLPVGGRTFYQFLEIMRTGVDLDHLHPNCESDVTMSTTCFPKNQPFNGDLLQVMPWPIFQSLEERDIRAIYEYLKAIPCVEGPATGVLHNDCM